MKTSNKILLGLFLVILLVIVTVMVTIRVQLKPSGNYSGNLSGKQTNDKREVGKFNQIVVEGTIKINYTQEADQKVVVKADSNLIRLVVSEVKNGKLYVYLTEKLELDNPIEVDISNDSINDIKIAAGGQFFTQNGLRVSKLDGDGSAGAIFEIDGSFNDLKVDISAGSIANFKGKCKNLEISASAGSIFNANDLIAEYGTISASAGAVLNVNVTGEISVDANAGSVIKCSGKAHTKNINISSGAQFMN